MDKGFRLRISIIFFLLLLFCGAVIFKSALLMLIPSQRLETTLKRQFREAPPPQPLRGKILDRNNEPLAMTIRVKSVYANPMKIKDKKKLARTLSEILKMRRTKVRKLLEQKKGFVWVKRHISDIEEKKIRKLLDEDRRLNLMIGFAKESKRLYPNRELAANLLGFTGIDGRGLEGIEYQYDSILSSNPSDENETSQSIRLTIDKSTQSIAERELKNAIRSNKAKSGVVVVMDAETGDIWAMASYPTYDPNSFRKSKADHRRNRPVTETFEPGSTVKALLIAAGLEEEILGSKSRFYCEEGKLQIGKHWIRESNKAHRWKWLSVAEILKKSSNIGATKIGMHIGKSNVHKWYKLQGLSERTGIDLPGEAKGVLRDHEKWSDINFSNITFGQGLSVTAIQIVRSFATLANGGFKVKPRIVSAIKAHGEEKRSAIPTHLDRVLRKSTVDVMTKMLSAVTGDEGTGRLGAVPGFRIAGKTGTAQIAIPGRGYTDGKYISSFAGFVIDTRPKFVGYVAIREPQGELRSGGGVAAPVFAKVMSATLAGAGVAPELIEPSSIELAKNVPTNEGKTDSKNAVRDESRPVDREGRNPSTNESQFREGDSVVGARVEKMPNITGLSAREVLDQFSNQDIRLTIRGSGIVTKFFPEEGKKLLPKQRVSVYLGKEEVTRE